jgi:hypothetical protein
MPRPWHATAMRFWKRLLKATAQCGMGMSWQCELALAVQKRHLGDLPAFGFFRLPRGVPRSFFFYQKQTNLLNCRISSSDTSGYHADFHEGHCIVREWQ